MWNKKEIDLGRVPVKKPITVQFDYTGDGIFKNANASCGCTTPKWDIANNSIVATYTPNPVPKHLKMKGATEYPSTKYIYVDMIEDGVHKKYTLTFKAKVFEV